MARLRYNGLATGASGSTVGLSLGASLTSGATSVTFNAALTYNNGTAVPTITGSDYIPLEILDANGRLSEIVYLTAYTAAATTGTISRGQEGTTGVAHSSGDKIVHGATVLDVTDGNETAASALVNATTAGDTGGRSDHFNGSSLTGWTTVNVSGSATITVGQSTVNVASSGDSYIYKAFTPSGAFTLEAKVSLHPGAAGSVDILVTDYTGAATPVTSGNGLDLGIFFSSGLPVASFTTIAAGTRTSRGSNTRLDGFVYLRITRDGSNNVQAFYSADRNKWIAFAAAAALTFTPARIVIRCGDSTGAAVDFIDVTA